LPPSQLRLLYWSVSFNDLKVKLKLRTGFEQVRFSQEYQILAEIISAAFGGKGEGRTDPDTNVMQPKNFAEATSMFAKVMQGR
jgi:hypothetical protein